MAVAKLVAMGSNTNAVRSYDVQGTSYDPFDGKILNWPVGQLDSNLQMIAKIAAICNDADVEKAGQDKSGHYVAHGMPTEAALKFVACISTHYFLWHTKLGYLVVAGNYSTFASSSQYHELIVLVENMVLLCLVSVLMCNFYTVIAACAYTWNKIEQRIATLEFDRDRKSMGVIVSSSTGNKLLVKGAVESLLDRSSHVQLLDGSVVELDQSLRAVILESLHKLSSNALRVLGFAYKDDLPEFATYDGDEDHPAHKLLLKPETYSSIESNLVFVGLAGLRDPPRKEVPRAIEDCRTAGIRVMVITGDNKATAEAICRDIGVFGRHENISSRSLTGKEFMELSRQDKENYLNQDGGLLFSRAEPRHKQEIVRLLKDSGEVVAMTGDGVNDAPALKLADIGIAMGIAGTEVAKEASDMVLADDNFSTIVSAVGEGRSIYNNMKAFIRYMISSNIGEVACIFLTAALGIPEGLIPVQLLWVNLVTDGPPATALGFNPPDKDIMKKPPRRSDDSLISPWILFRYLVIGAYVGIATVGIFIIWYTRSSFLGIDLSGDGHSLVTYSQLANWGQCSTWNNFTASPFTAGNQEIKFDNPCDYFQTGKIKAMTLSLSVLVAIEMFNSLNALSEDGSLLTMPPWVNPWLLLAMSISFGLHFLILYVPFLAQIFGIVPLSLNEWLLVLAVALPVILIDEVLKFVGRCTSGMRSSSSKRSLKHKEE
ncbi:PREDICTED: calcium-transporting ATPase 4, endoplasmic reticulum-type-like [Erythranthe guttata]|uniref:calcium-transporting ATPase 4, endoplasmic reticulum-type-like n=1 Tax=Erythranthe guttata TaxID=4155 RepID=UPI00064D757A|nr:PREDICTED: calcium-transporting ATPase 4, endoplasmic reticulum-type-like [Erythranthe guttata]|eukprot:XP_012829651.1 PREDICTED: calcium-transporting ATPase 4, endoplasmic reticulum-type-like [Erythranthe guttata]